MVQGRTAPYVWVSWITKYLAGDDHCLWRAWFKAHFTGHDKVSDDFDLASWKADHGAMVRERVRLLEEQGAEVHVEGENSFKVRGRNGATLAGQPDIITVDDGRATVIDCKTGNARDSDRYQVLVYMTMLPYANARCRDAEIWGEVEYRETSLTIPPDQVDGNLQEKIRKLLQTITSDEPPRRAPSFGECRFCDITVADCPDRIDEDPEIVDVDLF